MEEEHLVPIYKNKDDIQSCNNYRGIKLMSQTIKLWKRGFEHHLRRITSMSEKEFGFMPSMINYGSNIFIKKIS